MSDVYTKERTLEREIAPAIERSLPGVEVLALELVSPHRFCVYVDHPGGVDHALCERVTAAARRLPRGLRNRRLVAGPRAAAAQAGPLRAGVGRRSRSDARPAERKARLRGEVVAAGERHVTIRTAAKS